MKPKLLLLHGALGSQQQFASLIPALEATHEVHHFNFEGHGGQASDRAFSMELFSQNVLDYLDSKSIETISIFGYSMGGYVALQTALIAPERVKHVITLGTKFNWTLEAAQAEVKMLNPEIVEEKVPRFAEKLKLTHQPQDWKVVMQKTADMMLRMGEGSRLSNDDLGKIDHRVVIGIGLEDQMVTMEESERAARSLGNGQLIKLKQVKHPIESVAPQRLAEFITSHI